MKFKIHLPIFMGPGGRAAESVFRTALGEISETILATEDNAALTEPLSFILKITGTM
jgi:hypothetical protein